MENKELEVFKEFKNILLENIVLLDTDLQRLNIIEKTLTIKSKKEQAFDIILELLNKHCKIKLVDGGTYYQMQIRVMGSGYTFGMSIIQEEYDLLKEMLKND